MKLLINTLLTLALLITLVSFTACTKEDISSKDVDVIPTDVIQKIDHLGFSTDGVIKTDGGYIVENDIFLPENRLDEVPLRMLLRAGNEEQYRTNNLVSTNGNRVITMYAPAGGRNGYSAGMLAGLDLAIARYNAQNLTISFQRVSSSSGADIVMTRLSKRDERRGVLGSSGFPTSSGNPYSQIKMSGILESTYHLSTAGIATIIAHEMGHCIGFRHTDYFDRSISCGGSHVNEGSSGVGAILIPGTPSGASLSDLSWMLSCTDGGDRPFNHDDQTALDYLY